MKSLDPNVRFLGLNSFFTDISTEMILPLLPIFLERFLHTSKSDIGLIEGIAEFSAALLIALSGFFSDRFGSRKGIALFGYTLSNLTKPLMTVVSSAAGVMAVRVTDRIGKGIRTAPRDALIASYTDRTTSGKSFGFHKMMDSGGAFVGSTVAFLILAFYSGSESAFRLVFAVSLIPGILAFVTLAFFVHEAPAAKTAVSRHLKLAQLDRRFYTFALFQALFAGVAMNYSFFILKAQDNGVAVAMLPLVYAFYNLVQAVPAMKIGILSDRHGKLTMMLFAYGAFVAGTLFFLSPVPYGAWIGFGFYGLFIANFNALSKAIIADMIDPSVKATAYGVYFTGVGVASFASLALAGAVWDRWGSNVLFGGVALAGTLLLIAARMIVWPRIGSFAAR